MVSPNDTIGQLNRYYVAIAVKASHRGLHACLSVSLHLIAVLLILMHNVLLRLSLDSLLLCHLIPVCHCNHTLQKNLLLLVLKFTPRLLSI